MAHNRTTDLIVFGAGPAGLSATVAARSRGIRVMLIEVGPRVDARSRYQAAHLASGVGGAGLYSDGKFSYWPSASALWTLPDQTRLRRSYSWFGTTTQGLIKPPPFPRHTGTQHAVSALTQKHYASEKTTFEARQHLIRTLQEELASSLVPEAAVRQIALEGPGVVALVETSAGVTEIEARGAILAGGRFGGLQPQGVLNNIPTVFRRYEFGLRIVSTAQDFPFRVSSDIDPKLLLRADDEEWRTFCTIREGEVSETDFFGLVSYSGRADVAPTHFSNFGFNLRISKQPAPGSPIEDAARRVLDGRVQTFQAGVPEYMAGRVAGYGSIIDEKLRDGLERLLPYLGESGDDMVVIGPCIEGIGDYPLIDANLKVPGSPVWVAGDQTGLFRGLTAAFVSGHYVGDLAGESLLNATASNSRAQS